MVYVTLSEPVMERLDEVRGDLSRAAFIRELVYRELGMGVPDLRRSRNHYRNRTEKHLREDALIVQLHLQGWDISRIARHHGWTYSRVRWSLLRALGPDGIRRGRRGRPRRKEA